MTFAAHAARTSAPKGRSPARVTGSNLRARSSSRTGRAWETAGSGDLAVRAFAEPPGIEIQAIGTGANAPISGSKGRARRANLQNSRSGASRESRNAPVGRSGRFSTAAVAEIGRWSPPSEVGTTRSADPSSFAAGRSPKAARWRAGPRDSARIPSAGPIRTPAGRSDSSNSRPATGTDAPAAPLARPVSRPTSPSTRWTDLLPPRLAGSSAAGVAASKPGAGRTRRPGRDAQSRQALVSMPPGTGRHS